MPRLRRQTLTVDVDPAHVIPVINIPEHEFLVHTGKYVGGGRWDPEAPSKQVGAAVLLKQLAQSGEVVMQSNGSLPQIWM